MQANKTLYLAIFRCTKPVHETVKQTFRQNKELTEADTGFFKRADSWRLRVAE